MASVTRDVRRPARVGIVDDHPVYRLGLARLLGTSSDLEVAWDAGTAEQALTWAASVPVDLVLIDLNLHEGDSLSTIAELKRLTPPPTVAVISGLFDEERQVAALAAGAAACLPKDIPIEEMIGQILALTGGRQGWPTRVAHQPKSPVSDLSRREVEVLAHLRLGRTNRDIAAQLGISVSTINKHVTRILHKLGVRNRTEASHII